MDATHWMTPPLIKLIAMQTNARGLPVGESNPRARHPDAVVAKARAMRGGGKTYAAIGKELGVSLFTVVAWCTGRRRNVPVARIIMKRVPK